MNTYSNSVLKSRFCYNYKPQGNIETCCEPKLCTTNELLSSISSLPDVVNNNTRTSERTLLLQTQQQFLLEVYNSNISTVVENTKLNSSIITSTIYGQLLEVKRQRYEPYKPYIYPVMPSSVVQFQMATVNAGVPHSFFTVADCKGVQSVTT